MASATLLRNWYCTHFFLTTGTDRTDEPTMATVRVRTFRRPAFAIVYVLMCWTVLVGFCSLAVDFGHVRFVKTQLTCVCDAAARTALFNLPSGTTAAANAAAAVAAGNTVDGSAVVINPNSDVVFGTWDPAALAFTALPAGQWASANAVQVNARRTAANGNAVALTFAALLGQPTCDVHASAVTCQAANIGLINPSFESPALSPGAYNYGQSMPGWTLNSAACLETYGSAWGGPQPSGNQAISIQGGYGAGATITQTFYAIRGTYSVSFLAAQRTSYYIGSTPVQPVNVLIDGTLIAVISPTSGNFSTYTTPTFSLTSGSHVIQLAATDFGSDKTTFVDNVAINVGSGPVVLAQ